MIIARSFFLCLNANLLVTTWRFRGRGTRSHVWFLMRELTSSRIAFSHCLDRVGWLRASFTVAGSSSSFGSMFLANFAIRTQGGLSKSSSANFLDVIVPLVDLADDLCVDSPVAG